MIKIGSKAIDTNIFLAPLAGCSDLSFRLVAREHGAKFCFYEMLDANCLVRMKKEPRDILKTNEKDSPIAGQILGCDPAMMLDAAQKLISLVKIEFLDVNAACPAKKAIKKRSGSYLVKDKKTLGAVLNKLSGALDIPVTVKIRVGFDSIDHNDIREVTQVCQDNGAKCIFVHGRTRAQGYSGEIDYAAIKTVKDNAKVPVFGSGDVLTHKLAKQMFEETGCDGILVARGAFGNPWIFKDIEQYLKGADPEEVPVALRIETLKHHLDYIYKYKETLSPNKVGVMRKAAMWYTRGFPGSTHLRATIARTKSYDALLKLLDGIDVKNTNIQDRAYR